MTWSCRMRSLHRVLSIVFTAFVIANFATMAIGNEQLGMAVGGLTLLPLILLLVSGLYLFVLPYLPGSRGQRDTDGRSELLEER